MSNDFLPALSFESLAELPAEELLSLYSLAKQALAILEARTEVTLTEAELPRKADRIAREHTRKMQRLTGKLAKEGITQSEYNREVQKVITQSFTDSYAAGKGVKPSDLTDGDLEWLRRAAEAEAGFARQFGKDIRKDKLRMPRQQRAALYGLSCEGIAWAGRVEAAGSNDRIHWRLGHAEHCPDCLILAANGPYTKENLPTTPKAGDTECRTGCKCRLEFSRGQVPPGEREDSEDYTAVRDAGLRELAEPEVPPGMRAPGKDEQRYIDGLRARINYHRRAMALTDDADEKREHASKRKAYNDELIEFLEKQGIYEVPVYSVDDVIDGRHLGRKAKRDIFNVGLDGKTLSKASRERLKQAADWYRDRLGEEMTDEEVAELLTSNEAEDLDSRVKPIAIPYRPMRDRGGQGIATWCLQGANLAMTRLLLIQVAEEAAGTSVQIGPFDDELIGKVGVWIEGPEKECEVLLKALSVKVRR